MTKQKAEPLEYIKDIEFLIHQLDTIEHEQDARSDQKDRPKISNKKGMGMSKQKPQSFDEQLANPIKIEVGQKIDKPGIYDIPIDWYHDDCCVGPSVSSTGIKQFLKCPVKFWQQSYLNPNRLAPIKKKEKSFFEFGHAAHTLFLGDEDFKRKYVVREFENEAWTDWKKQAAKAWRDDMHEKGFGVLTADDMERLRRVSEVCKGSYQIHDLGILQGYVERSLIWFDKKTGIWIKARPDCLPPLERTVVDLKTFGQDADFRAVTRQVNNLDYHIQLGLIRWGLRKFSGDEYDLFFTLFIENDDFPAYSLNPINIESIIAGERQAQMAVEKMAECWTSGVWPTYSSDMQEISLYDGKAGDIETALYEHENSKFKEAAE